MSQPKSENKEREQYILDAAVDLIVHYGYDKTTVSDIAREADVSKGAIYLHFSSKEDLFEALVYRETLKYRQTWLDHIEVDPQGGTVGGIYRAVLSAINSNPFMSAMVKRDRRIFGSYLRKPNNLFAPMQSGSLWLDALRAMQEAGVVRQDVDVAVMIHIMDLLSYGLVSVDDFKQEEDIPPFEVVMATIADMMDQLLMPTDGGNSEAGKAIVRQVAAASEKHFAKMKKGEG